MATDEVSNISESQSQISPGSRSLFEAEECEIQNEINGKKVEQVDVIELSDDEPNDNQNYYPRIEMIERSPIPDTPESPTNDIVLYEYSNGNPMWNLIEIYEIKMIDLQNFKPNDYINTWNDEFYGPDFLKKQLSSFKECHFTVKILQTSGLQYQIILKASHKYTITLLKNLLSSWLRNKNLQDVYTMNHAPKLPSIKSELFLSLINGIRDVVNRTNVWSLSSYFAMKGSGEDKNEKKKKLEYCSTGMDEEIRNMMAIAYNNSLIVCAETILNNFKTFMRELIHLDINNDDQVPPEIFMIALWFNFELFIPRRTQKIVSIFCDYVTNNQKKMQTHLSVEARKKMPLSPVIKHKMITNLEKPMKNISTLKKQVNKNYPQLLSKLITFTNPCEYQGVYNHHDETEALNILTKVLPLPKSKILETKAQRLQYIRLAQAFIRSKKLNELLPRSDYLLQCELMDKCQPVAIHTFFYKIKTALHQMKKGYFGKRSKWIKKELEDSARLKASLVLNQVP